MVSILSSSAPPQAPFAEPVQRFQWIAAWLVTYSNYLHPLSHDIHIAKRGFLCWGDVADIRQSELVAACRTLANKHLRWS